MKTTLIVLLSGALFAIATSLIQAQTNCFVCSVDTGCKKGVDGPWEAYEHYDNTCEGERCAGGAPVKASTEQAQIPAPTCRNPLFAAIPTKHDDFTYVKSHYWTHDEALPVWLANNGIGTQAEVQETLHVFTGLQVTIFRFARKGGSSPIEGFSKAGYSFALEMGREKDVLTIHHASGAEDSLTLFPDGTYTLMRTKN